MESSVITPRALFDGTVSYEVPPFQRPYVWNEEDQWQPLWDDIARVADAHLEADEEEATAGHFLGAVVLKWLGTPAGQPAKHWVIDGQQRLTTLQLLLDAAQLALQDHGSETDAESMQELVANSAKRFRGKPQRFKLWPSRVDRDAYTAVMDNELSVPDDLKVSRIVQVHDFFYSTICDWAEVAGDPDKAKQRLATLSQVLQQHLQLVQINLSSNDDDQLIFETLNDRGTPLLAADLIKNFLFQECEEIGADVDAWNETYWQDFDEDWWRDQVAQGRLYRSRIDLFLQYWLTMRRLEEIPSDAVFSKFRDHSKEHLETVAAAEAFLKNLRSDADMYRDLVTHNSGSPASNFYGTVVETLELGTFIPLLLWLISEEHSVPSSEVAKALAAVESFAIRRMLLRMTMKDINNLVLALLRDLDGKPLETIGSAVVTYLAQQTADARTWPTDDQVRSQLPSIRAYGNIKQPRLRVVLSAVEMKMRTERHENVSLPTHLEIEHVMPRGWRAYWGDPFMDPEESAKRDVLVDTIGNLTLVTKKLNGTLSNRPWTDQEALQVAPTGRQAGVGKRSLLSSFSLLVLNKEIIDAHVDKWTEGDIKERAKHLTEAVISVWPREGGS